MNDYIAAILFFLPAGVANMTPPLINKLPYISKWKTPLDFGRKWQGKPIFGDNKTWRGLLSGILSGGITAVIVSKLNVNTVVTIDPIWVGLLMGFGALAGDAAESFLKRRSNLKPGQSWFPFDQIDYIIGGLLITAPFVIIPGWAVGTIFVVYLGLHLLIAYLGYLLKLKDSPI